MSTNKPSEAAMQLAEHLKRVFANARSTFEYTTDVELALIIDAHMPSPASAEKDTTAESWSLEARQAAFDAWYAQATASGVLGNHFSLLQAFTAGVNAALAREQGGEANG
jgi:hypothetical protein